MVNGPPTKLKVQGSITGTLSGRRMKETILKMLTAISLSLRPGHK